jgi:hypothetical protein
MMRGQRNITLYISLFDVKTKCRNCQANVRPEQDAT